MTQFKKSLIGASLLLSAAAVAVANPQSVSQGIVKRGCYSSTGSMSDKGEYIYQSQGACKDTCIGEGKAVMALTEGSTCWCGDEVPSSAEKVDDSNCQTPCQGFPEERCGGNGAFGVFLTGIKENVPEAAGGSSNDESESNSDASPTPSATSTSRPSTTPTPNSATGDIPTPTEEATPSTITQAGETIVITAPSSPDAASAAATPSPSGSSGPNKAGIAAGIVVGIVAVAAIIGGVWLVMRNRKRRALEEEYRRNAVISDFASKKPDSASSLSDARLEPSVMMQRRQSDGSIADNQDYSRRILKVTNPDGRN